MARGIVGQGFATWVQDQISFRQKQNALKSSKGDGLIKYQTANTAFLRLSSGINIDDKNEPAKAYQLFNLRFNDQPATGVDLGTNSAYGFLSTSGYGYVPPPGLISADIKALNRGSLREATVEIKAHSMEQFEIIDKLYLRLGFSMLLEWGWSFYYDNNGEYHNSYHNVATDSFFFKTGIDQKSVLNQIQNDRDKSHGNYDAMIGLVKNYSWSLERDGSYNITLKLVSLGDVIESIKTNSSVSDQSSGATSTSPTPTEDQPPIEFNRDKTTLNKIFWYFISLFDSGNEYDYIRGGSETTAAKVSAGIQLTPNQSNDDTSSVGDLVSFAFPQLNGISKDKAGVKNEYYIKLGCLLRQLQNFILYYSPSQSDQALINFNFDPEDNFMFTFPRHGSLDPRVCLVPLNYDNSLNNNVSPPNSNSGTSPLPATQTAATPSYVLEKTTYTWNVIEIIRELNKNVEVSYNNGTFVNNEFEENTVAENLTKNYATPLLNGGAVDLDGQRWWYANPGVSFGDKIPYNTIKTETTQEPLTSLENFKIVKSSTGKDPITIQSAIIDNKHDSDKFVNDYVTEWVGSYASDTDVDANFGSATEEIITAQTGSVYLLAPGHLKSSIVKEHRLQGITSLSQYAKVSTEPESLILKVYTHQAVFGKISELGNTNYNPANVTATDDGSTDIADVQNNLFEKIKNTGYRVENYDFIGRLMNVYINMNYAAKTLDSYVDIKTGNINLYDFLDKLMSGVQNALGNVNTFNVIYDEDNNAFKIQDSTFIPQLSDYKPDFFKEKPIEFITHTLDSSQGSFIREASVKTELSNNFATQVTIGAQANGNVVGENSTSLSKWNKKDGVKDRIILEKTTKNNPTGSVDDSCLSNKVRLHTFYSYVNDGNLTEEQIDGIKDIGVDLFRYEIGTFDIPGIGFLPINLELTMDGLSGMKIYESYTADTRLLPKTYKDAIQFIIKGVSHKIQNNDWTTTISSISGPKYDGVKTSNPAAINISAPASANTTSPSPSASSFKGKSATKFKNDFDNLCPSIGNSTKASSLSKEILDRAKIVKNELKVLGLSDEAIYGLIGCLIAESSINYQAWNIGATNIATGKTVIYAGSSKGNKLDGTAPNLKLTYNGKNITAYGIAQWTQNRKLKYYKEFTKNGKEDSLQLQAKYMAYELSNNYKKNVVDRLKTINGSDSCAILKATMIALYFYEGVPNSSLVTKRYQYALGLKGKI